MTGLYVASNPASIGAQIQLQRNINDLGDVLTRLSTGLRINSGKDDPAGLIASELLKSDISASRQAIQNTQRANSVIAVADSALGQVSNLLNDIRVLVNASANTGALTPDMIAANQLQVDASIDSIDRIAKTTNFQGQKLLDGSMGFKTVGNANNAYSAINNVKIQAANFGLADSLDVSVKLLEASKRGTLIYNGTGVDQDTLVSIGGSKGSELFKFGAGTTNAEMAEAINRMSDATGVVAGVEGQAARGSITLSSAGANNDIVITANEKGLNAGNYTFRIVQGHENDARIVTDPTKNSPGIVEITLEGTYEQKFTNFAGMYNITTNTDWAGANASSQATSVSITRGTSNSVQFFEKDSDASATSASGVTGTVDGSGFTTINMSQFNGWTLAVDDAKGTGTGLIDYNNKTIYFDTSATVLTAGNSTIIDDAFALALGGAAGEVVIDFSGIAPAGTIANGTKMTFKGGGDEGELFITYKEGTTVGQIQDMINSTANVQATLANGVNRSDLIKNIPSDQTRMVGSGTNAMSKYTSGATAQTVIDLINSKLGDKFTAAALTGNTSGGRVSYQDAVVDYGSVNLDNAIRFTGMDDGPVIRLAAGVANQELGLKILMPSAEDIANGIHTPVLQINLATDASGNSITTAKQIVDMFNKLTAADTLGVSASLLLPPGVDPNGRTWTTDYCGNESINESCGLNNGNGLVQPTGTPGPCGIQQNDLLLLGNNQAIAESNAVARIGNANSVALTGVAAVSGTNATLGHAGTTLLNFGNTSSMNGVSFGFTYDETKEGFDATTGKLTVFLNSTLASNADLKTVIDSSIAANWEAIREYTGAVGGPVQVVSGNVLTNAQADATSGATTAISKTSNSSSAAADLVGTRGVGLNDAVMTIMAKDKGIEMAGIDIIFAQDDGLTLWGGAGTTPEISVAYQYNTDGSIMNMVVKANMGTLTGIAADDLANALNANTDFNKWFQADAAFAAAATATGRVGFSNDPTVVAATTTGGYKIVSDPSRLDGPTGTSSGITMTGQSDSNERLVLQAMETGSDNFVDVRVVEGSFTTYCPLGLEMSHLAGTDSVVTVNGQRASTSGDNFKVSNTGLQMSGTINNMGIGQVASFAITGGGATFQLGPDVVSAQQIRIGIEAVDSTTLGGASGKLYMLKSGEIADLKSNTKLADRIVQEAINSIAVTRGNLGAVQRGTLEPNQAMLEDTVEQLSAAEALISNADFAEESSRMTRAQVLIQSGSQALAMINQFPQYAAQLLR
ncbi:MAG: hypothetical protein FWC43_08450 [Planctomycetaceae bacterium]|nr:hypothetical protein [Planctomycetaceae bacterium]